MLQIRVGHAGENFYGQVVLAEDNKAVTFFCGRPSKFINAMPESISESNANYTKRALSEDTRFYSEVLAVNFHPHQAFFSDFASGFDLKSWAKQLCERLMDTANAVDGASHLVEWLRWLGDVVDCPSDTSLVVHLESLARIPGPDWAF